MLSYILKTRGTIFTVVCGSIWQANPQAKVLLNRAIASLLDWLTVSLLAEGLPTESLLEWFTRLLSADLFRASSI